MATTIKSPQDGYNGVDVYGPLTLEFKDGVATTDETLTAGHKAYFKKLGFKVSGSRAQSDADKAKTDVKAKEEADAKAAAVAKAAQGGDK